MYNDEQLIPISALQHFVFCPRRAALMFTESQWAENRFTMEGSFLHRRTDDPLVKGQTKTKRVERSVWLVSRRYGLIGKADVVEFHPVSAGQPPRVHLVEYKRGKPKKNRDLPYRVQLCAQALCIEEMLSCVVEKASLYHIKARKRVQVSLDESLRALTQETITRLHQLIESRVTPSPDYQPRKCRQCSLINLCMPTAPRPVATASRYLRQMIDDEPSWHDEDNDEEL